MLELVSGVSGKRDARPERQSSWRSSLSAVRGRLAGSSSPLALGFAGFVLWHFSAQAYRASTDGALPESGFEQSPWFVGVLLLLFWLPFTVFGLRWLSRTFARGWPPASAGQERALAVVESLSLAIVLMFGAVHGLLMAWPLVSGSFARADVRPELVAGLSSTWRGFPAQGVVYLCAVGAASFCAARSTLRALPPARPWLARAVVGLAVLAHLLGSYAVIRCGSGSLLP
jgi:hypothetical protein